VQKPLGQYARRQRGDHLVQLGARHARADQFGLASRVNPVHRKHALGEIDADEYDSHGLPLPSELMRVRTSHRGTLLRDRMVVIGYTPRGAARHVFSMRKANDREQALIAPLLGI
jgi:uncharacterized DUF497 family protein